MHYGKINTIILIKKRKFYYFFSRKNERLSNKNGKIKKLKVTILYRFPINKKKKSYLFYN